MRHRLGGVAVVVGAVLVAAGGFIHLREWLDTYRNVPSSAHGAFVVRVGFPLNAAVSAVLALALVATAWRFRRHLALVLIAAIAFQAASLAALIVSRTGNVFGWREPVWTDGANQARAVEIAALVSLLGAFAAFSRNARFTPRGRGVPRQHRTLEGDRA